MTRFTTTARAALMITIASGFLAMTPPAFAAGDDNVPEAEMPLAQSPQVPQAQLLTAGTDFASVKSVAHLKSRLRRTAYALCAADWDGKTLMSIEERQCYVTALHNGLAQIDTRSMEARRATSTDVAAMLPQEHPTH